jgi:plastocyanin domain-containing protein
MNAILVNIGALVLIAFIVWWFGFSRPRATRMTGEGPIDIMVENGVYTPARIEVTAGRPVILRFNRRDPSPCAEKVLFGDLGVAADLELGKPTEVRITSGAPGEHKFTCQMGMYRGTLVVR